MPSSAELVELLMSGALKRDVPRLQDHLRRVARLPDEDPEWSKLVEAVNRSRDLRERRAKVSTNLNYPADLPIVAAKDDIAAAIRDHQVVVLAGETGSGKTTQLPKICLELGRGVDGIIGHTQPRRIAARTVAARIADELGSHVGGAVGYKVRFTDQSSPESLVKLMTDGILLAETQNDPLLKAYDTIIIDEAHERTLNIDFLLGYLKQLLPQRPDLKLIITSATIDPKRFSDHFGGCPMLEVSGRTFPVETRYRPLLDEAELKDGEAPVPVDPIDAIVAAVEECRNDPGLGDILVFLASEREIRESAIALTEKLPAADWDILPLYARLSVEEQQLVFKPGGKRRVVLATNVAETSITVPNIRYVVDPGEARISRYSTRTKVQRLPIEPISQASANQRKGRCGRVSAGVCIRLYSEEEFNSRQAFTDPEILRTNLASVILQMAALKLGDVEEFPFIDSPDTRQIRDGYNTLFEIGAVTEERKLTDIGRRLARLPADPRMGRMILAGLEEGVLDEVLVIAAGLSVQDPRDRPLEAAASADSAHAAFKDPTSDFMGMLKLWEAWQIKSRQLSSRALRKWCRDHFLSYTRMREWQETHRQLRTIAAENLVDRIRTRHKEAVREERKFTAPVAEGTPSPSSADRQPREGRTDREPRQGRGGAEGREGRRGRRHRGQRGERGERQPSASPSDPNAHAHEGTTPETATPDTTTAVAVAEAPAQDTVQSPRPAHDNRRGGRRGRGHRGRRDGSAPAASDATSSTSPSGEVGGNPPGDGVPASEPTPPSSEPTATK